MGCGLASGRCSSEDIECGGPGCINQVHVDLSQHLLTRGTYEVQLIMDGELFVCLIQVPPQSASFDAGASGAGGTAEPAVGSDCPPELILPHVTQRQGFEELWVDATPRHLDVTVSKGTETIASGSFDPTYVEWRLDDPECPDAQVCRQAEVTLEIP